MRFTVGHIVGVVTPRRITSTILYVTFARIVGRVANLDPIATSHSTPLILTVARWLIKTIEVAAGFLKREHAPSFECANLRVRHVGMRQP